MRFWRRTGTDGEVGVEEETVGIPQEGRAEMRGRDGPVGRRQRRLGLVDVVADRKRRRSGHYGRALAARHHQRAEREQRERRSHDPETSR